MSSNIIAHPPPAVILSIKEQLLLVPFRITYLGKPRFARLSKQPDVALAAIVLAGEGASIDSAAELDARVSRLILAVRR